LSYRASILEGNAEKVAVPPNQPAPTSRSEIVKGHCELNGDQLAVLTANACTGICDVADSASIYIRFLTEKNQCAFLDFRPADRSAFERAFPSIEAIQIVEHCAPEGRTFQLTVDQIAQARHVSISQSQPNMAIAIVAR
jgi:hypothetical protein